MLDSTIGRKFEKAPSKEQKEIQYLADLAQNIFQSPREKETVQGAINRVIRTDGGVYGLPDDQQREKSQELFKKIRQELCRRGIIKKKIASRRLAKKLKPKPRPRPDKNEPIFTKSEIKSMIAQAQVQNMADKRRAGAKVDEDVFWE